jgi:hypothetical protein
MRFCTSTVLLMTFFFYSCGPSDGKRLATDDAIKNLEEAYSNRDSVIFEGLIRVADAAIERARQAGDPSRKADVQLTKDLDVCQQTMHSYLGLRQSPPDKERAENSFRYAINALEQDLGN